MTTGSKVQLAEIYRKRFEETRQYRTRVWRTLIEEFFCQLIPSTATVLDLGCGYGEFINRIGCVKKYAMDLNPDAKVHLAADVELFEQDCSMPWPLGDQSLDVVFTSNFFEHLPDKAALDRTFCEAFRCLRPGGRLIAIGPNIKCVGGRYWDFWDHQLPLTELSLAEGLASRGFAPVEIVGRFLPYTLKGQPRAPQIFLRWYLRLRFLWPIFGRQFLVVVRKP